MICVSWATEVLYIQFFPKLLFASKIEAQMAISNWLSHVQISCLGNVDYRSCFSLC